MTLTDVVEAAGLMAVAIMLAILGGCAVVAFRLRRRWRRSRYALFGALFARVLPRYAHVRAPGLTDSFVSAAASPAWWLAQRDRHSMRRSVTAARRAVSVATRADAPVGDLPSLLRQLEQAAGGVDAALRASAGQRRLAREANVDRLRVEAAAADIRAAAVMSLDSMRVDVQPLVSAIGVETDALAAGVRAAQGASLAR
jgi:hypothetical protein